MNINDIFSSMSKSDILELSTWESDNMLFLWVPENSTSFYIKNKTENRTAAKVGSPAGIRVFSKS